MLLLLLAAFTFQHPLYRYPPKNRPADIVRDPAVHARLVKMVYPSYTPEARKARIEGVILELVIEKDGRVSGGSALKPLPFGLTQKAIDAVREWRYAPARDARGRPVRTVVNATVPFQLSTQRR